MQCFIRSQVSSEHLWALGQFPGFFNAYKKCRTVCDQGLQIESAERACKDDLISPFGFTNKGAKYRKIIFFLLRLPCIFMT